MFYGAHFILFSTDANADRAFFRDVLDFPFVDAGQDWLIFSLPPSEVAVHPAEVRAGHDLFLMTDELGSAIADLERKGVECSPLQEERWGTVTKVLLPGGGEVGIYQPKHLTSLGVVAD